MTAPLLLALGLGAALAARPPAAPSPATPPPAAAPSAAAAGPRTLTIDDAIAAAVANRPTIRASREAAAAAEAAAREARGALLPQIGLAGSYTHARVWNARTPATAVAAGAPATSGSSSDSSSATLSGDLLLWDFGQTANRWRSARSSARAASDDARATVEASILEARQAYFGVLAAIALDRVAADTLANSAKHLADTETMVQTGTRAPIDLAQLRTQVASARAAKVRTGNAIRTARTRLDVAMGTPGRADYEVATPDVPALAIEQRPTDALFADAVQARPELASLRASIDAGAYALRAADRLLWPSIHATAGGNGAGADVYDPTWTASAGVTLRWTLFDGLTSRATADAARARMEQTRAQLDDAGQQVWQQIDTALADVASGRAQLPAAEEGVAAATDLLGLAEARYREGVGSSLELADAQLSLANAQAQRIQTEYDLASARARLLSSVGQDAWR
ncbi:MAG TPA: TolC family protein [Anaeromyxobacter sp.]